MRAKEVTFTVKQTGYERNETTYSLSRKFHGTSPDIHIEASGAYSGILTLSVSSAKQLVDAINYLLGGDDV